MSRTSRASAARSRRIVTTIAILFAALTIASIAAPAPSEGAVTLGLVSWKSGFSKPVAIANAGDGSGRIFVVEQAGRIRIVTSSGTLVTTPFLDIHAKVSCCGEQGLLGLAFHPSYKSNGRFYVYYTDTGGSIVIAEYRRSSTNANRASPTERRLLKIAHPTWTNHDGGQLAFGPDGYLYIGTGDGGSGGDPHGNAQNRHSLLGKILRIAPNVTSSSPRYRIPSTNPWATSTTIRHEIWAYGVRNPWRFSFDRLTGDLWIADVGQDRYEEVNRSLRSARGGRGANFGWNHYEGYACYKSPCTSSGKTFPITTYKHGANGCAVVGGYVYRGSRYPALAGRYLFGDYCSGRIWSLSATGGNRQKPVLLRDSTQLISAFGQDEAGELYLASYGSGRIYKITGS
jgi:glucose/arabinose dehydrogenase